MLLKKRRRQTRAFIIEGVRACEDAIRARAAIDYAVVSSATEGEAAALAAKMHADGIDVFTANEREFARMSDTKTPQGIIAVARIPENRDVQNGSLVALDKVSDPGNVGAIIRSAAWFGLSAVILGPGCADPYNPKTIRATMGSLFSCNVVEVDDLSYTLAHRFNSFEWCGATATAKKSLDDWQPSGNFGIVLGSEAQGITPQVRRILHTEVAIRGAGRVESLNVGVAAGIIMYHCTQNARKP